MNIIDQLLKKKPEDYVLQNQGDAGQADLISQIIKNSPPINMAQEPMDIYNSNIQDLNSGANMLNFSPEQMADLAQQQADAEMLKRYPEGWAPHIPGGQPKQTIAGDPNAEPTGMGDSLKIRSGDDIQDPDRAPAIVDDPGSASAIVASATPVPGSRRQYSGDDELIKAQGDANFMASMAMLTKASEKAGRAIAGSKSDPTYMNDVIQMSGRPVQDLIQRRKADADSLDMDRKKFDIASLKDSADPNSETSKFTRDSLKQLFADSKVNLKVPDGASAADLNKLYPQFMNHINMKLAQEAKLEATKLANETKKEAKEEKRDNKKFDQEKTLRVEIAKANKETNYTQTKFAYKGLKEQFDSGKFNGIADVAAIYAFIKALDPGSVVRETETELVLSAQSPLARFGNQFQRITKGDLASSSFRKKLLDAMDRLVQTREKEFQHRVKPHIATGKHYELNMDNIIAQELGDETSPETESSNEAPAVKVTNRSDTMVTIRQKSTGKTMRHTKENAEKILQNPNYEVVK